MKSMLVLMAFFAMASATVPSFKPSEKAEEDFGRLFLVSNNGGTYLGLNSTLLWTAVLVAAVVVVGAFVISSGALPLAAKNYQRLGQEFLQDQFYEDPTQYQNRYKRFAANGNVKFFLGVDIDKNLNILPN